MKRSVILLAFAGLLTAALHAQNRSFFRGTVVRMQMASCASKNFMAMMSGAAVPVSSCPEYTIVSDKVVYIVVARRAEEFMPLAEDLDFIIRSNELILFSEDEKRRSRFVIQQMVLRSEWERDRVHREAATRVMERSAGYRRDDYANPVEAAAR